MQPPSEAPQVRPLLVVGDFVWDVLIRTETELLRGGDTFGRVELAPGGSAANAAVWARRCGLPTRFVGKVGDDRFADLAANELRDEGVEATLLRDPAHPTGTVAVWIDEHGQRSMVSGKGADHMLRPDELPEDWLRSAAHLHLSAWSCFDDPPRSAVQRAAALVKEAGGTVSFDPGSFQMIEQMGVPDFLRMAQALEPVVLFPNVDEGRVLSGQREPSAMVQALARLFPGAVIALKLDRDGALLLEPDGRLTPLPSNEEPALDATGAGDTFAGAFLSRWLRGVPAAEAGRFAVAVSNWVVGQVGARPAVDGGLRELLGAKAKPVDLSRP